MIELIITDLTMKFGDRLLFSIPHLTFHQQQTIYLKGQNGAGKTTLMKLLAGLISPTKGNVKWLNGQKHNWWKKSPQRGEVVYLHQHSYLFEGSVQYNLGFGQQFSKLPTELLKQRQQQAISMANLSHLLKEDAANLSGGERQRLVIARAWIIQPKILLLDEPISNMDEISHDLVLTMIKALKDQGTGMLISSHQASGLTKLCEQTWLLNNQQISCTQLIHEPLFLQEEMLNANYN